MKKILLVLGLLLHGATHAASKQVMSPKDIQQFQLIQCGASFVGSALLGFCVNFIGHENKTKSNSIGLVMAACGNYAGLVGSEMLLQSDVRWTPFTPWPRYNPVMHAAVATSGYIVGGVAGSLTRSLANKFCSGVAALFAGSQKPVETTQEKTETK